MARLDKTLEKNLVAYGMAATAVGVGALSLARPAEAKIIYTPTNVSITNGLALQLNNNGVTDFVFNVGYFNTTTTFCPCSSAQVKPTQSGNLAWGERLRTYNSSYYKEWAAALPAGVTIRSSKNFKASATSICIFSAKGEQSTGPWWGAQNRYLGLKFYVEGQAHYGWARASFSSCTGGTLTGYAYETVPNKPIKTGKTKGPDVITVEPATLGRLALGRK